VNAAGAICYPASITWWKKGNDLSNVREIKSEQEFYESLEQAQNKLVLVEFFSVGCRSCKAMHPKVVKHYLLFNP
jgi:thiol:disulfide interchange protein